MMGVLMSILRPIAYLSLPVLALQWLSSKSPQARYYVRVVAYVSTIAVVSTMGVVGSVFLLIIGKPYDLDFWIARTFHVVAGRMLDINFTVEGEEYLQTGPAILVANHQSMIDVLVMGPVFPRRTVISAKKELIWAPFLGPFLLAGRALLIDRSNPKRAIASMDEASNKMKQNSLSLWVFPEGTRSLNEAPTLRDFKKGAFHLAVQTGFPIIPIVCENYWRLYHGGVFESGTVKIKVLPPIPTTGLTTADVSDLAVRTREIMLKTLHEISPSVGTPKETKSSPISDAILMPPPSTTDVRHGGRSPIVTEDIRPRTTSLVRSIAESEDNGSIETEEEDGHVLVRRPAV